MSRWLGIIALAPGLSWSPGADFSHGMQPSALLLQFTCYEGIAALLLDSAALFLSKGNGGHAHCLRAPPLLMQVARYEGAAAMLEDPAALSLLHYDRGRGVFADFGNHTEALQLGHSLIRAPNGQPVGREVKRVPKTPGDPPQPQMVPHFG